MELNKQKQSDIDDLNKINFKIFIATGGEYTLTANSEDIFKDVLNNFFKIQNLKELEGINTGICNGGIINFDKNLEENNIKENSSVILYSLNKDFTPNPDVLDEKIVEKEEKEKMKI